MPIPPKEVQAAARKALEVRAELPPSRKAGTPVGIARANQLANGENISEDTLLRMWSYLRRTDEEYKRAKAQGKDITNSKQILATYLWGGPAALAWVRRELNK